MKLLLLLVLLLSFNAHSIENKTFPIGMDRFVDYEIQDGWKVFKKNLPAKLGAEAIKIITDHGDEIQGLFMVVKHDNPALIKAGSTEKFIEMLHAGVSRSYSENSVEGFQPPRLITINDSLRLESTFTDKSFLSHKKFGQLNGSSEQYKYATLITYFIGPQETGVAASIVLLSNELSGSNHDATIATINSFAMKQ